MKDAYTTQELMQMIEIASRSSVIRRARREGWQSRPRAGRGGGHEWLVSSMPEKTRLTLAARVCTSQHQPEPYPLSAVSGLAAPASPRGAERPGAPDAQKDGAGAAPSLLSLAGAAKKRAEARAAVVLAARMFTVNVRLAYTRALDAFAQRYNAGEINVEPWVREVLPEVCRSSLMRWDARVRQGGAASLAGNYGRHRKGKGLIDSQEMVENTILGMFARNPHVSARVIHEQMQALAHKGAQIEIPSLRRVQAWLAEWKRRNESVAIFITSPDRWRGRLQSAAGDAYELITKYNQRWEYDGTPADLMLNDGKRYTIVGIINVYSRELKLEVAERSTGRTVANLTRRCLLDWGVPDEAVTDNGKEFVGMHMQGLFLDLDIMPTILPPFRPELKPAIERVFRTFSHHLLPIYPCYLGHNVATRQEIRERETFAKQLMNRNKPQELSMAASPEDLQKFCDEWTDNVYRHKPHGGLKGKLKGMTPWEVRQAWDGEVRRIEDERALDVLLMDCGWRSITKEGVRMDRMRYAHAALGPYIGQRAQVRVDPADRTRAWIFREDENDALQFVCQAVEITGLAAEERAGLARDMRRSQRAYVLGEKRRLDKAAEAANAKNAHQDIMDMFRDRAAAIEASAAPSGHTVVPHESAALSEAAEAVNVVNATAPKHGGAVADAARATALKALEASDSGSTDWLPQNPRGQYKLCRSTLDARERGEFVEPDILAWAQTFVHSNTYQGFALADGQALAANG